MAEVPPALPIEGVTPDAPTEDELRLIKLAGEGDAAGVKALLKAKVPAYATELDEGCTALMAAAKGGHAEVISLLVQYGAPWNAVDRFNRCAGDYAIASGQQEIVDQLVQVGVQAELLFAAIEAKQQDGALASKLPAKDFLKRNVRYEGDALLDDENRGVMMQWEEPLMDLHAERLCASGGDVLNVGFGMGYVDTAIQRHSPKSHTIIEAHPQVYQKMIADGWDKKPNVRIVFGKWQDVIGDLGPFDGVFFDTFDDVGHVREFHAHLDRLVKPGGMYSYFNGVSDNVFFLGVACEVFKIELAEMGFETVFDAVDIDVSDAKIWEGTAFRYFQSNQYYLPTCIKAVQGA
eukprot:Rhum_TRINITY_DN4437_c0_g2::Rhum_TRINITY_DN4437_c0_g2_i1::g.14219::m.14219/K18477/RMT2; type IV protein arginine methyltransferase